MSTAETIQADTATSDSPPLAPIMDIPKSGHLPNGKNRQTPQRRTGEMIGQISQVWRHFEPRHTRRQSPKLTANKPKCDICCEKPLSFTLGRQRRQCCVVRSVKTLPLAFETVMV